jgi:hypothetical protein
MSVSNGFQNPADDITGQFLNSIEKDASSAVEQWRSALVALQPHLAEAAVRTASVGLTWSGRSALNRTASGAKLLQEWRHALLQKPLLPKLPFLSQDRAYAFCASIVHQRAKPAASLALRQGRTLVLGLRKETSTLANNGRGIYDDFIVVLNGWNRRGSAHFFTANTDPSARYAQRATLVGGKVMDPRYKTVKPAAEYFGEDVNRDGIADAGRLVAGTYFFAERAKYLNARAFMSVARQTVERDSNGDGRFTIEDSHRIDAFGVGATMLIHVGGETMTGSAGCQTIPPHQYPTFLSSLGPSPRFYYVLVDCRE